MVYVVRYRLKLDEKDPNSKFGRTLFAESAAKPSREKTAKLLNDITEGKFLEDSIQIHELRDFEPAEVRSQGGSVFRI